MTRSSRIEEQAKATQDEALITLVGTQDDVEANAWLLSLAESSDPKVKDLAHSCLSSSLDPQVHPVQLR